MESRLVLVIEGDDHIANQLAAAIREADYEVVVSTTAGAGLAAAIEIRPDCVICDVDLPDDDGYSVARALRAHPSPVAVTPFALLSAYDDPQARLEGFHVGADVYITKPLRVEEVVAQVDALVHLAARLRRRRDSMMSIPPETQYGSAAIEGDVRQMSVATVLSVLGMERRTGVFEVVSKKRRAQVEIVAGYVVHGTVGGTRVSAMQSLRLMLSWKVGRFSFIPLPPCDPPPSLRTVQALLLDAAKAEDEAAAGMPSSRSMYDGQLVTSFGGPPSRPDDTAPPSSRAMREAASAPVSLAFDLISSRRSEELPSVEGAGAASSLAALDRGWGGPTSAAALSARRSPGKQPPEIPARSGRGRAEAAASGEESISIDFEEVAVETSISVSLEELEAELSGDRVLIEETPRVPSVSDAGHRATPTPPSGMPIVQVRRTAAIVPPPDSAAKQVKPLPAPPAPPRPAAPPRPTQPRPAPRTMRTPQRATTPKK